MSSPTDAICPKCESPMLFQENVEVPEFSFPVDAICCCRCGYREVLGRADQDDDLDETIVPNVVVYQ